MKTTTTIVAIILAAGGIFALRYTPAEQPGNQRHTPVAPVVIATQSIPASRPIQDQSRSPASKPEFTDLHERLEKLQTQVAALQTKAATEPTASQQSPAQQYQQAYEYNAQRFEAAELATDDSAQAAEQISLGVERYLQSAGNSISGSVAAIECKASLCRVNLEGVSESQAAELLAHLPFDAQSEYWHDPNALGSGYLMLSNWAPRDPAADL